MADKSFSLLVELKADIDKFKKGMDSAKKQNKSLLTSFKSLVPAIGAAFAVAKISAFTKEAVVLAAKVEGVRTAFMRLDNATNILAELKTATRDTVSEFKLMQMTVEASNMGINVENLGKMFEFATKQAIRTGKSVDYLIEQLVLGIGRKSVQRLDDLGISLVQIQEEVKKTGDFTVAVTNIIDQNLAKMGEVADTAATEMQRMQTIWDNFKADAGAVGLKVAARNVEDWQSRMALLRNKEVDILTKLWAATSGEMDAVIALAREWEEYNKSLEKTPTLVEDITWKYKEGIDAGIDWAKVNSDIFKQWVKENDIIKAQISLREQLTEAIEGSQAARLEELKSIGSTHTPMGQDKSPEVGFAFGGLDFDNGTETVADDPEVVALTDRYDTMLGETREFTDQMNSMLTGMAATGISDFVGSLFEGLASGDMENFFSGVLSSFGKFMTQMGEMLIAYGIGMEAFKKAFSNPFAAIAAGIALVAVGGAMSGAAASFAAGAGTTSSSVGGGGTVPLDSGESLVVFEIEGDTLRGVLNNNARKNNTFR